MYDELNNISAFDRMDTMPYTPKDSRIVETEPQQIEYVIYTTPLFSGID